MRKPGKFRCACGETDPDLFYGHKKRTCARCHLAGVTRRGKENRELALEFLGGKCSACGFSAYKCSLDIHHPDPEKKDEHYRSNRGWSWARMRTEIDGCLLLCKNCHAAHHFGLLTSNQFVA